jgi:D-beta-D-heptose 7-phosphate kinase/D-beta-D-heptose 1-phosphate adenosyltransferase
MSRSDQTLPYSSQTTRRILTPEEAEVVAARYRNDGKRVVFTNGCFDLLHVGHLRCLEEASCLGDVLFVAINSDASVRKLKGAGRPVVNEHDRAKMLASLRFVDYVVIFDDDTPIRLVRMMHPDVLVKGGTYSEDKVVGGDVVTAYGGRVCVTSKVEGMSTTQLVSAIRHP